MKSKKLTALVLTLMLAVAAIFVPAPKAEALGGTLMISIELQGAGFATTIPYTPQPGDTAEQADLILRNLLIASPYIPVEYAYGSVIQLVDLYNAFDYVITVPEAHEWITITLEPAKTYGFYGETFPAMVTGVPGVQGYYDFNGLTYPFGYYDYLGYRNEEVFPGLDYVIQRGEDNYLNCHTDWFSGATQCYQSTYLPIVHVFPDGQPYVEPVLIPQGIKTIAEITEVSACQIAAPYISTYLTRYGSYNYYFKPAGVYTPTLSWAYDIYGTPLNFDLAMPAFYVYYDNVVTYASPNPVGLTTIADYNPYSYYGPASYNPYISELVYNAAYNFTYGYNFGCGMPTYGVSPDYPIYYGRTVWDGACSWY